MQKRNKNYTGKPEKGRCNSAQWFYKKNKKATMPKMVERR